MQRLAGQWRQGTQAGQQLLAFAGQDIVLEPVKQEQRLDIAIGGSTAGAHRRREIKLK